MWIYSIGHDHNHDGSTFLMDRPNGTDTWLLLIIKTPAVFRINGELINVNPGYFILYSPFFPQYYYTDADNYCDDWVQFHPSNEEVSLIQKLDIPLNKPTPAHNLNQLSATLKYLLYENYSENPYRDETVDCCFKMILYKLAEAAMKNSGQFKTSEEKSYIDEIFDSDDHRSYNSKLLWLRQEIYLHPGKEWAAEDMAHQFNLSISRFQHIYKETFGTTVKSDVINSRIAKASKLLSESDMTVQEIAIFVGYTNVSYFRSQFKSVTGSTPQQYRNDSQNK